MPKGESGTREPVHRRSRPRRRNPYRDNVLTVPATPEQHAREEAKIREAYRKSWEAWKPTIVVK